MRNTAFLLLGLGLILAGVSSTMIALGVGGFALMLIGAVIAYSAFRVPSATVEQEPGAQASADQRREPKSSGFMDRLEDRWRKRNEEGGL